MNRREEDLMWAIEFMARFEEKHPNQAEKLAGRFSPIPATTPADTP